tara:strand:- start:480 stop:710 length:231 start_codon:yes stop_codon:yes gene_type:complete
MNENKYIQVDGFTNLARSKSSGAIVNINSAEMTQARIRKYNWKQQQNELETLRNDVAYMKEALAKLVEEKHGNNNS